VTDRRVRTARAAARTAGLAALLGLPLGCFGPVASVLESLLAEPYREPSFERKIDLMPPEGIRITSSADRQVGLAWNPVLIGDVAGYAVTRSEREDGPYSVIGRTMGRFAAVYSDAGQAPFQLGDGKTYHYRVHPFDGDGNVGERWAYVSARTDPRPSVPAGFQAYSNLPRRVALAWEPSLSSAVIGYSIFRSPSLGGTFEPVAFVEGRLNSVFEDPVPGDLRVMYYKVQALNRFGGTSDPSEAVRAVTKPEPLPPTGLHAGTPHIGAVDLRWEPNVEPDLVAYQIWRERAGERGQRPVASVAADSITFTDRSLGCGERARYTLRAIDRDGLLSDFSDPLEVATLDLGLAVAPRSDGAGVELRWRREDTGGWPSLRIVELRSLLPDRELGTTPIDTPLPLPLAPGRHRIAATLTRGGAAEGSATARAPAAPGAAQRAATLGMAPNDAPTCRVEIDVPAAN
jgi:hypothetical protein